MNMLRKSKIFASVLLMLFTGAMIFCFGLGTARETLAQQPNADNEKIDVIKIPPRITTPENEPEQNRPQSLQTSDITIITSEGTNLVFRVELARTENEKQMGLMYRSALQPGTGMLFLFDDVAERAFWMKNTWIPLDIIFIREDGVIHSIHHEAKPHSLERISSDGEIKHVLEIAGGEAERQGISPGDRIIFD